MLAEKSSIIAASVVDESTLYWPSAGLIPAGSVTKSAVGCLVDIPYDSGATARGIVIASTRTHYYVRSRALVKLIVGIYVRFNCCVCRSRAYTL